MGEEFPHVTDAFNDGLRRHELFSNSTRPVSYSLSSSVWEPIGDLVMMVSSDFLNAQEEKSD